MRKVVARIMVAGLAVVGGSLAVAQPAQAEGCTYFNTTATGVSLRCNSGQIAVFRAKTQCRDSWRPATTYWAVGPYAGSGSASRAVCRSGDYRTNYDSADVIWR